MSTTQYSKIAKLGDNGGVAFEFWHPLNISGTPSISLEQQKVQISRSCQLG